MVLGVSPQRAGVAIRLATSLRFALERLLVAMCQHVTVSGGGQREREMRDGEDKRKRK